jgi:hypothetical protein
MRPKNSDPEAKNILRRRIDQPRVRTGGVLERHDQNIVNVLGEIEETTNITTKATSA